MGAQRFAELKRATLLDAGGVLNLAKLTASRLLDNLCERIVPAAETLYADIQAENASLVAYQPALAATLAGESRCLRAIVHGVIKEMVRQMAFSRSKFKMPKQNFVH